MTRSNLLSDVNFRHIRPILLRLGVYNVLVRAYSKKISVVYTEERVSRLAGAYTLLFSPDLITRRVTSLQHVL